MQNQYPRKFKSQADNGFLNGIVCWYVKSEVFIISHIVQNNNKDENVSSNSLWNNVIKILNFNEFNKIKNCVKISTPSLTQGV